MRAIFIVLLAISTLALWCSGCSDAPGSCLLTIGFFNAMRFGHSGSFCKDLDQFAEILSRYDLVGLAEIMRNTRGCEEYALDDLGHLQSLVARLALRTGVPWTFVPSPKSLGSGTYKEYYAFVYRTDRVSCLSAPTLYPDPNDEFERDPFIAEFRSGSFDFAAIVVHVTWGNGTTDPIGEVTSLDGLWDYVQALNEGEEDIILMGDFNVDSPSAEAFSDLRAMGVRALLFGTDSHTTYSTGTRQVMANGYDNLWVDPDHTGHEFADLAGVDYLHTRYFLDSTWPHIEVRRAISDHCPVWAQFFICAEDDD